MTLPIVARNYREQSPLVFCLTNTVVTNFTANVLLASGAAPAMTDLPGEAGPFAAAASAMLVNLGTPTTEQLRAMEEAVESASAAGTPWVLDPVAVGALPVRTEFAQRIVARRPTLIRGNASEIMALAGWESSGRGVDSLDVIDAQRTVLVHTNGIGLTRITGGGCALGAVCAGMLAVHEDPFEAAVAAHGYYGLAAEKALAASSGPGSFAVAFLDSLAAVEPAALESLNCEETTHA